MFPIVIILGVVAIIGGVVYYFQFSERAIERTVKRIMSQRGNVGRIESDYRAVITDDGIACEHPKRPREFIQWNEITEISIVKTSDGPWLPDLWVLFVGSKGGCSIPTEASEFDKVFNAFQRFSDFNYGSFLKADPDGVRHVCWSKVKTHT